MRIIMAFMGILTAGAFLGGLGEYILGHIMLPSIGLHAPAYWTCFWFSFWLTAIILAVSVAVEWIKEL